MFFLQYRYTFLKLILFLILVTLVLIIHSLMSLSVEMSVDTSRYCEDQNFYISVNNQSVIPLMYDPEKSYVTKITFEDGRKYDKSLPIRNFSSFPPGPGMTPEQYDEYFAPDPIELIGGSSDAPFIMSTLVRLGSRNAFAGQDLRLSVRLERPTGGAYFKTDWVTVPVCPS